jgi:hypothetical protein
MTDIVERLRDLNYPGQEMMREEAADEIERLRNTIAQLRAVAGAASVEGHSYADIREIRNAKDA